MPMGSTNRFKEHVLQWEAWQISELKIEPVIEMCVPINTLWERSGRAKPVDHLPDKWS